VSVAVHAPWGTRHGDGRNGDFVPVDGSADFRVRRKTAEGVPAATFAALDGADNVYLLTLNRARSGRGHLWSFAPDGALRWTVALERPSLTSPAVAPEGTVYVCDGAALRAVGVAGETLWRTPVDTETAAVVFLEPDTLGVLGLDGVLHAYDRRDGREVAAPLALPAAPMARGVRRRLLPLQRRLQLLTRACRAIGVDPDYCERAARRFLGVGVAAKNVPAVHPLSGRVFVAAADATGEGGRLFGVDLVGGSEWRVAFEASMGPGCDTSPVLSADGTRAYCVDRGGVLHAFETEEGGLAWTLPLPGGSAASPAMGEDDRLYVALRGEVACVRDEGARGVLLWVSRLDTVARGEGLPRVGVNSVLCLTRRYVYGVVSFGPRFLGRALPRAHRLVVLDREDGAVVSTLALGHESFCTLSMAADGSLLVPSKPFHRGLRLALGLGRGLPPAYHGLVTLEPAEGPAPPDAG
jgi:outer membrane protein assembly factor BamB